MRKEIELAKIPHVLELNRIKRAYTGGKLLDEWQRLEHAEDGKYERGVFNFHSRSTKRK